MRTKNGSQDAPLVRTGKGRAVLVGYGLDDVDGHVRFTRSSEYELLGGSETTHAAMQAKAREIQDRLGAMGYALDSITREQIDDVRRIVDAICDE